MEATNASDLSGAALSEQSQLDDAHLVADPAVEVDGEADLLALEALRAVHVPDLGVDRRGPEVSPFIVSVDLGG